MGVTGLWKLIEPCGKPVPVETLEGKILAVDISIWLHQAVKGFQDNKGAALNNAHLLGLFHRLCKLMYYRVKPVFVFDGCVPQLKKDTIAHRQQQRSKLNSEADRIQALLLQSLAKEKVVQQALGPNAEKLLRSPIKQLAAKGSRKDDTLDEMFKLPEMPLNSKNILNLSENDTADDSFNENSFCSEDYTTTSASADSSLDESNTRSAYNTNLQAIDVRSKEFLQLPADVRHEILVDIKETRKQSSWGRLHELPSCSDDFSNFQMKRLLKRRDVQVSLETAEQEMGGRTLTYAELTNILSEEGILETGIVEKGTKQICSDEHTRFLLVKDLKNKLAKPKEGPIEKEREEIKKEPNISSKNANKFDDTPSTSKIQGTKFGNEYEADLELAIALSLQDDADKVYDEKDYDYDSDESLKLTKVQRQHLQNAAKGPARSYMIEYAGMNKEEVAGILEKSQAYADLDETLDIDRLVGAINENFDEKNSTEKEIINENANKNDSQDIRLCVTDDSDHPDSELEEVENSKKIIQNSKMANDNLNMEKVSEIGASDETDSDLEEVKDSDATDSDFEEVGNVISNKNNFNIEKLDLLDECIIEETPPCLPVKENFNTENSKTLNIEIDFSKIKPLEPTDDIFADIFKGKQSEEEILAEDLNSIKDERLVSNTTLAEDSKILQKSKPLILNDKVLEQIKPPKTENILSILDDLKQQANEIKNIKLENIKLNESVIEISDDESALKVALLKNEVIELCDSDDNEKRSSTPPPHLLHTTEAQSPKLNSKSPKLKTPTKNHSITEFFNIDYVVKRSPDKPLKGENEVMSKVKSPFFVRKTPKSDRKSSSNNSPSTSPNKRPLKVNKSLFGQENENSTKDKFEKFENDFIPLQETKSVSSEDVLNEAVNILKSQKTAEELHAIASDLAKERKDLESERNRQDRMGMSITQRMNSDCQELLRLFGVPFIVAPMEAEAQCAFLDIVKLTHGTITDDSDIWLFGGRTVYKNFFAQNKHVLEFRSEQIEKDFNCDRKKLIQLACLVGSDYTTGVHGIGAVTALEILASFTSKEEASNSDNSSNSSIQNILDTLQRFRNWWQSIKSVAAPPGSSARLALQKKLKNIDLNEGFPNTAVIEAYLTPKVDENKEAFSWGVPDVESLREFAKKSFGWTTSKTDDILMPIMKKLNEKRTQQSIKNYFNVKNALSLRQIKVSKRVQNAIEKMSGHVDTEDSTEKPTNAKRARKNNNMESRKNVEMTSKAIDMKKVNQMNNVSLTIEPSCSNTLARGPIKRSCQRVNIPETKQIIPQREKDLEQMRASKKLAAEIFKNTAKETKRKRKQ